MLKTRSRVVVSVSLALGMLPVGLHASDWRTYLHDNTRGGATDEHLVLPLQQHWKTVAPGALNMAWSGPNGRIIEGKVPVFANSHKCNVDRGFLNKSARPLALVLRIIFAIKKVKGRERKR